MTHKLWLLMVVIMAFWANIVIAQPPIGDGGGLPGGDNVPDINVEIPDIEDIDLDIKGDIDVDINSEAIRNAVPKVTDQGGNQLSFDASAFSEKMKNYEVPENWSDMQLTGEMPSKEEIEAMKDALPVDIDDLDIGLESSASATSAIVGYASSMLGLRVTPLYAGEYGDSDVTSNEAAQATISKIYSQLDPDMQAMLSEAESLSGVAYWALLEDGLALLYTGDCDLEQCTIEQGMVQVEITSGSVGAYALYSDAIPSSTDEAKTLVQRTYPYLASIDLSETESDYGTAFFAFNIDVNTSQVTAYYAGVYSADNGKSIVYAISGIGDAYINMLLGG